jgi:diacylglycerol kinase (ATP)
MARPDRSILLLVNPTSGGGRGSRVLREALPVFRELGVDVDVHVTANGAEPTGVARAAADRGVDLVVAVGGDGHLAAVGEGLVGSATAMAVLPAGSANDYARTIRMPDRDTRAAIATILSGSTERVDAVRMRTSDGERVFLNVVGTGFDAEVAAAAEHITVMRGAGRYVLAIMRVLPRFKAASLELTIDGHTHNQRAMMIAIANGPAYGGGMRVAPAATLTSGELEICIVGEISKPQFIRAFPRVFRGTHVNHPAVTMLRGREIAIDADRPLELIGDGERTGHLPATITVLPKALSMVVGHGN